MKRKKERQVKASIGTSAERKLRVVGHSVCLVEDNQLHAGAEQPLRPRELLDLASHDVDASVIRGIELWPEGFAASVSGGAARRGRRRERSRRHDGTARGGRVTCRDECTWTGYRPTSAGQDGSSDFAVSPLTCRGSTNNHGRTHACNHKPSHSYFAQKPTHQRSTHNARERCHFTLRPPTRLVYPKIPREVCGHACMHATTKDKRVSACGRTHQSTPTSTRAHTPPEPSS